MVKGRYVRSVGSFRKAWTEGNEDISDGAATEQLATDDINVRRSGASARHVSRKNAARKSFTTETNAPQEMYSYGQPSASPFGFPK